MEGRKEGRKAGRPEGQKARRPEGKPESSPYTIGKKIIPENVNSDIVSSDIVHKICLDDYGSRQNKFQKMEKETKMSEKMTLERFNSLLNLLDIEIQETERVLKSLESLQLKTYGPYQILIDGIGRCHQQKKSFLQEYGIHYEIPEKYLPVEDEILLGI